MTEPWKIVGEDDRDLPTWPVTLGTKPGPFAADLRRLLKESDVTVDLIDLTPDPGLSEPIEARKATAYMPVSCCMLTDTTGVMHCIHPPAPRPPWRTRLRWGARRRWANLRLRVGTWVAGVDLSERD